MAGRHWAKDTSEPPAGPIRIRAGILADTRITTPVTPKPARFRATTIFQINQHSAPDIIPSSVPRETSDQFRTNWYKSQVKAISSRSTLVLAVKNLKLGTEWKCSSDDAAARLAGIIKVEAEPNADIVSLSAWSDKAEEAAAIANGVRDAYAQRRKETEEERLLRLHQNVTSQITLQEAAVDKNRLEMLDLMIAHNIVELAPLISEASQEPPEAPEAANQTDSAENEESSEAPMETDPEVVAAERQKQSEYATAKFRYESQRQLLNSMRDYALRNAEEAASRNPLEILEPAVAVEDR